jgi:hypothetical protein
MKTSAIPSLLEIKKHTAAAFEVLAAAVKMVGCLGHITLGMKHAG